MGLVSSFTMRQVIIGVLKDFTWKHRRGINVKEFWQQEGLAQAEGKSEAAMETGEG